MTISKKPIVQHRGPGDGPDAVDRWLLAFFRSEMPARFPAPALPAAPKRRIGWRSMFRSRLALAASIALLLTGSWFLAGQFQGVEIPSSVPSGGRDIGKRVKPPELEDFKDRKAHGTSSTRP